MQYYLLRLLTIIKKVIGFAMSKLATLYNKLSERIKTGVQKEENRILDARDKKVEAAKSQAVVAAQRVIKLQAQVEEVAKSEDQVAFNKLTKLKTKVQ